MDNKCIEIGSRGSLLKNSFGILLSRLIMIGVSLVSVPIVIAHLGMVGYGVWEAIIAISVLCNIVQGTISGTLLWKFSNAFGANDPKNALELVRIGIFTTLLLFFLITPIAWGSRGFLVNLFHVPAEFRANAEVILPLVVALMVLGSVTEVIGALLSGFQRSGIVSLVQSVSNASNYGVVVLGLFWGFGFWSLLLGFATAFVVSLGTLYGVAWRVCGPISLLPRVPSLALIRDLKGYSGFMLLHSVAAAFRDQTDRIVLTSMASPIWTGYFGIAARLASLVGMVCQFLYVPVIAAAGALGAREDWVALRRLYTDTSAMLSVMVGLLCVIIAALHDQLFTLWLGHPVPEAVPILYLLLLGSTVMIVLSGVGTAMCKGIGMVRMEALYICVGLILNVILKFLLVPSIGALGTVVASAASMVLSSALFLVLMHRQIKQLPWSTSAASVKTLIVALGTIFVLRILSPFSDHENTRMDAFFSLCKLVPLAATIYFVFLVALRVVLLADVQRGFRRFTAALGMSP